MHSTEWGKIDARELTKECISLPQNNPTKFEINVKYTMLCGEPNDDGGNANQAVYGYMQLLREGHNISPPSTKQALGREPIQSINKNNLSDKLRPNSSSQKNESSI